MKRVTIKDVAREAGVSSATVSYVLNGLNKVTPEVDSLVWKVAESLGYRRNNAARALKTGKTHVIGCLLPSLVSPVFPEIVQSIQFQARKYNYTTVVIDTGNDREQELEAFEFLIDSGVDGAIALLNADGGLPQNTTLPFIVMDGVSDAYDSIECDHYKGGRLAAEYAIRLGHKKIGLLSGEQGLRSSFMRYKGFTDAAEGKLDIVWNVNVPLVPSLNDEARQKLMQRDITLLFCVNDLIAIAAIGELRMIGLKVPDDVSVIGFDDMQWSRWPMFELTTIHQPLQQLGMIAVDLLIRRLNEPQRVICNTILDVSVVERGTTRPLERVV